MKTAAVTGANGFLGSVLVELLLKEGWTVHGTVRSIEKSKSIFEEMPGSKERLKLFQADLLDGSEVFRVAFEGCSVVHHVAARIKLTAASEEEGQREIVDPALQGTKNVLDACAQAKTVTRVVVTSSVAAVMNVLDEDMPVPPPVFDEKDWNTTSTLRDAPYRLGKRLAEEHAWQWAAAHPHVAMSVLCPFLIVGPLAVPPKDASSTLPASQQTLYDYATGAKQHIPRHSFGVVDVRDVALAHVLASTLDAARGQRYVCVKHVMPWKDIVAAMRPHLPPRNQSLLPTSHSPEDRTREFHLSSAKIERELGLKFTPLDVSLKETFAELIKQGWL